MTETSHTTGGSTGSSTDGSSGGSTARLKMARWTHEEILLIQKQEIRDEFYLASRHGKVDEFLAAHFPMRTKQAVWQKIWQIEKLKAQFCDKCGSKLK